MPLFSKYTAELVGPVDKFDDRIANARRNHFDKAVSSGEDEACTSDGLKSGMPHQKRSASTDRIRNITTASAVAGAHHPANAQKCSPKDSDLASTARLFH